MKSKWFGDKQFYKNVMTLTFPIMIQNFITNFVSMLDNVMVGQIGTVEMTGVSVTNTLIFVFNLCIFGAVSGAGIFGAQFYGNGDHKGVRDTFRFKVAFCTLLTLLCMALFYLWGKPLISLYLQGKGSAADAAASLLYGQRYLQVILFGLIPYALTQVYSSTLRETGNSMLPMLAGLVAVGVNLSLNYVLIFGHFGAPALGVEGAAIATVISRFVELLIVALWTGRNAQKNPFIIGAFRSLHVPGKLVGQILVKGTPLMLNETVWAASVAVLNQCYSVRGLDVVAANNISTTFWNVFSVAFMAVGMANGILLGQLLGAGKLEQAKADSRKLIVFSLMVSAVSSVLYAICAIFIPQIYNTTDEVRTLATQLMWISALAMPLDAFANAAYFTLRSGGQVLITFLFDSAFMWVIVVPLAFSLSRFTDVSILYLFAVCQFINFHKDVLGYIFVKKGLWIKQIVS